MRLLHVIFFYVKLIFWHQLNLHSLLFSIEWICKMESKFWTKCIMFYGSFLWGLLAYNEFENVHICNFFSSFDANWWFCLKRYIIKNMIMMCLCVCNSCRYKKYISLLFAFTFYIITANMLEESKLLFIIFFFNCWCKQIESTQLLVSFSRNVLVSCLLLYDYLNICIFFRFFKN